MSHDNWQWHDGPVPAGPAVVFDLDGVLSDAAHRQHLLAGARRDWEGFFDACGDDPLVEDNAALLGVLAAELAVVILTARPARVRDRTAAWLHDHHLRWDLLVMRDAGDYSSALDFKRRSVRQLRAAGFELVVGFEDDRRNVEMLRAEGVACVYMHSGYYD